jgi:hypothetical protein
MEEEIKKETDKIEKKDRKCKYRDQKERKKIKRKKEMRRIKNQKVKCKREETSWKMYAHSNTAVSFSLSLPLDIQFMKATPKQEKTSGPNGS